MTSNLWRAVREGQASLNPKHWIAMWREGATSERRWFRNSGDPTLQGDGWRWSLSFHIPAWPVWTYSFKWGGWYRERLCNLVLTEAQRDACYREWEATQQDGAREHLGRELTQFELDRLDRWQVGLR